MNPPKKCCITCEYACAPNTAGCICTRGGSGIFHAGTEPCEHYRLADFLKRAQADPHRCRGCPECAVIFDSEGIHGHVPDSNSKTCRGCEHCKGVGQ